MTNVTDERRKRSKELADRGFERLRDGAFEAALEIAKELEKLKYSAAFDIGAQACAGLGDFEKAIETLERGVTEAPKCWANWELLGNYLSDMRNYEKAADAYERALACPGVWADSIRLNQAILASRRRDNDRALVHLDMVCDPHLSVEVAAARIAALEDMGRADEALSVADECLSKKWEADEGTDSLARIAAAQGRIRLGKGLAPDDVRRSTMAAIARFGSHDDLLALVRDIDGRYSTNAQYFRLLVHASLPEDHSLYCEAKGYFITYDVVAETVQQGLGWLREFESADASPALLRIEKSEALERRPEEPMGVYWRSGRCYYEEEK